MKDIRIFKYNEKDVRTVEKDGELWWVLKDVCEVFGEVNYRRVSARLDDDEKGVSQINTPGGAQTMTVVNEAGLYSALFAMQPEKARGVPDEYIENRIKKLKSFKRWVTHEVLPSVRKHGAYMTAERIEAAILNPDTIIKLATELKNERERAGALNEQLKQLEPKAEYYDAIIERGKDTNFTETAKLLGVKVRDVIGLLTERRYIYRNARGQIMPYSNMNAGYFSVKESLNKNTGFGFTQTLVTPKGRDRIMRLLKEDSFLFEEV